MNSMELAGYLKMFYLSLVFIVISLMVFYAKNITASDKRSLNINAKLLFYCWIIFLCVIAVLFHFLTAWHIPWVHQELNRSDIKEDQKIVITVKKHNFFLPSKTIKIRQGDMIKFSVLSQDLTYGFGVFTSSGAMEFQMQVIPHHKNEILWVFTKPGEYSIRSTEYAGPQTLNMYLKNTIKVIPKEGSKI